MGVVRDATIDNLTQAVQGISSTGISDSTGQAINNTLNTLCKDTTGQSIASAINSLVGAISPTASNVTFDNTGTDLSASNVQAAIEEIDGSLTDISRYKTWSISTSTTLANTTNVTIIGDMSLSAGIYIITAVAQWGYSSQGARRIYIANSNTATGPLNNARNTIVANNDVNQSSLDNCITMIFNFTSNVTLFLRAFQSSGNNLNVMSARVSAFKLI